MLVLPYILSIDTQGGTSNVNVNLFGNHCQDYFNLVTVDHISLTVFLNNTAKEKMTIFVCLGFTASWLLQLHHQVR